MKNVLASVTLLLLSTSLLADERSFSLDVPAGELTRFELQAKVGEVSVRAADIDSIEVRVKLKPGNNSWFGSSDDHKERLKNAELRHDDSSGALRVSLDYDRSRLSNNDLQEYWEIRLPARMATKAELNVGSQQIIGLAGGVEAEVNVGELRIEVLRGDVDARVNVGEVNVRSATRSPGRFDLDVNIGDVRLDIDGRSAGEASGFIGKSLSHQAGGDDDVRARANVGEVRVSVRP